MRLLPLVLSAHASGFNPGSGFCAPENGAGSRSCQFCGLEAACWQERFHLNGDHDDEGGANVVSACVLCHLCQHLERWSIDQEAILIWLPELTQGAVIALARDAHRRLAAHEESLCLKRPTSQHGDVLAARNAFMALKERADAAFARLGTASPRDLGAALLGLSPESYARRDKLLGGLRLLPLGRLLRGGRDVYPALLSELP